MQSSADPTPLLGGEVPLDHVVSQPIHPLAEKVVMPMQSSADPTPLLQGEVPLDHVVPQPIQPLVITLICTKHAYLASGHLIFLLYQATTEHLF
jgi:hypothetical protein